MFVKKYIKESIDILNKIDVNKLEKIMYIQNINLV